MSPFPALSLLPAALLLDICSASRRPVSILFAAWGLWPPQQNAFSVTAPTGHA